MTFGITEPAAVTATTAPLIIVVFIQRARPRAPPVVVLITVASAGRALSLIPAAARSFRMTSGIAVPAAMTATAAPLVIALIIPRARARAGEPTLLIAWSG